MTAEAIEDLDQSLIERLENLKDLKQMSEDTKFLSILGITKDDLDKRKELEGDKLLKVLCPDGITQEERDGFEVDTQEFLEYFYANYMVKEALIPGTEVYSLFRDSLELEKIKTYLDKLSQTITQRFGVFGQVNFKEEEQVKWESPIMKRKSSEKLNSVNTALMKKADSITQDPSVSSGKGSIAQIFLSKINTMGFLNKII